MGANMCHTQQQEPKYVGEEREKGMYTGDVDELGRPDGQGVYKYRDGSRFSGDFKGGFPHHGKFEYINGDVYEGYLHKCEPHGQGVWKEQNGTFDG